MVTNRHEKSFFLFFLFLFKNKEVGEEGGT